MNSHSVICAKNSLDLQNIGGVVEDVLGHEGVLEDTFCCPWPRRSSPWPWPRSLKVSKIALFLARGQQYFLELLKFCRSPEKFSEDIFCRTHAPVPLVLGLGHKHSCPWPRGSVLGSAVLFFGLRLFLNSWPRALCSRLHLCCKSSSQ